LLSIVAISHELTPSFATAVAAAGVELCGTTCGTASLFAVAASYALGHPPVGICQVKIFFTTVFPSSDEYHASTRFTYVGASAPNTSEFNPKPTTAPNITRQILTMANP